MTKFNIEAPVLLISCCSFISKAFLVFLPETKKKIFNFEHHKYYVVCLKLTTYIAIILSYNCHSILKRVVNSMRREVYQYGKTLEAYFATSLPAL